MESRDPHQSRILVDLDGTLTIGRGTGRFDFAPIATGAEAFLKELHAMFDEVVICTARAELGAVKNFIRQNGLARYINDYTNLKLPAKLIVEDRSVVHKGDFADTLSQIKKFHTWWETEKSNVGLAEPHSYASTQFDLPPDVADIVKEIGLKIPDEHLQSPGDTWSDHPREDLPHITLLYGIESDTPEETRDAVKGFGPIKARLGTTGFFEVKEKGFDVVRLDVRSPDLHRLRKQMEKSVDFHSDFPDYVPHATVAYVKPGMGKRLSGDRTLDGTDVVLSTLVFSNRNGQREEISLA